MKISVVIPCFNEKDTILKIIEKVRNEKQYEKEIIVIDDFSTDNSQKILQNYDKKDKIKIIFNPQNKGKGYSIRQGLKLANGDIILIQDADLEYSPDDYKKLIEPILNNDADVVYGSRTMNDMIWDGANMGWFLRFGNWSVAKLLQILFNTCSLTDVGCTYRLVKRSSMLKILKKSKVVSNFFGPEMMLISILSNLKIIQIPINYRERVGISSVTGSFKKAFMLGIQMILLILKFRIMTVINNNYLLNRKGIYFDKIK